MNSDCIIIGGGLIGMMTARELAREGASVTILERGLIGRESSWAGGGILSTLHPWRMPEALGDLVQFGQEQYPQICAELLEATGIDPQYRRTGMLNFDVPDLTTFDFWKASYPFSAEYLTEETVRAEFPTIASDLGAAVYMSDLAQVRNPRLVQAMRTDLLQKNVKILEQTEVIALNVSSDRISGVTTTKGDFHANQLVLAAGAWSGFFGLSLEQIFPVRGQMLRIHAPELNVRSILLNEDSYIIPRQDGQLVIGSTVENCGFDKSTTRSAFMKLKAQAEKLVPALKSYSVAQQWSGLRPGTVDGIPLIQRHAAIEGFYINAGHYRNGVILAPGSSRRLVDLMLNRTSEPLSS